MISPDPESLNLKYRAFLWCGREDSNFHNVTITATSTLRVYQFRHDRMHALQKYQIR